MSVTLALHWTERVKSLAPEASRQVYAEMNEYRFYCQAVYAIYTLYAQISDPRALYEHVDARRRIADKLAWPVECFIYRLQQMKAKATGEKLEQVTEMLLALNEVSDYFLPRAVPVVVIFPALIGKRKRKPFWNPARLLAALFITTAIIITLKSIYL